MLHDCFKSWLLHHDCFMCTFMHSCCKCMRNVTLNHVLPVILYVWPPWRIIDCLTSIAANCWTPRVETKSWTSSFFIGFCWRWGFVAVIYLLERKPWGLSFMHPFSMETLSKANNETLGDRDLSTIGCQVGWEGSSQGIVPAVSWPSDTKNITKRWLTFSMTGRALVGLGFHFYVEARLFLMANRILFERRTKGKHFIGWIICIQLTL